MQSEKVNFRITIALDDAIEDLMAYAKEARSPVKRTFAAHVANILRNNAEGRKRINAPSLHWAMMYQLNGLSRAEVHDATEAVAEIIRRIERRSPKFAAEARKFRHTIGRKLKSFPARMKGEYAPGKPLR
jgi:hypothetical protein